MRPPATFPHSRDGFLALLAALFPEPELSGLTVGACESGQGARLTVAYIADLIAPDDLHDMILAHLSRVPRQTEPAALAEFGCFPAPVRRTAANGASIALLRRELRDPAFCAHALRR